MDEVNDTLESLRLELKELSLDLVVLGVEGEIRSFASLSGPCIDSILLSGGSRSLSGDDGGHSAEDIGSSDKVLRLSPSSASEVLCDDRSCFRLSEAVDDCNNSRDHFTCSLARLLNSCRTEIGTFAVGGPCPGSGGNQAILMLA